MFAGRAIRRILLIRLRSIGDVIFTTPAIAALRRTFPDAHLAYVVEPAAAPILAGNPHLDELIVRPRQGGLAGARADLRLGLRLRRARFDLALDFHGGPRASLLAWLSGAPTRIGYAVPGRGWMYTHRIDRAHVPPARHSVENQWDLLTPLGIAPPSPLQYPVEMPLAAEAAAAIEHRLARWVVGSRARVIVIHVSASSPFRRWPLDAFAHTVAALAEPPDRHIVVTSGPSEHAATATVVAAARARLPSARASAVVEDENLSLAELRALLERAALYIGGDTGPLHVAATTTVPIVALFGPTPAGRSHPWRDPAVPTIAIEAEGLSCRPCDQRVCIPGDFRCLSGLSSNRVIAAAEQLLAATRRTPAERV